VRGHTVNGHPVVVRRLERIDRRPACNVLFVGPSRRQSPAQVLDLVKGTPILTVTDEGQDVHGGIVHFVVQGGRVRFSIDAALARAGGLALSSKLRSLAIPTRGGGL
ncbi:MAG: YfiR family protein, partial [Caulobacteraceae bacterium]